MSNTTSKGIDFVSEAYWQAKIWGLLHDPIFKALHSNQGRGKNSFWQRLEVMQDWVQWNPEESCKKILKHIRLADYIASASDRGAIGSVTASINYNQNGIEVSHLLSGRKLNLKVKPHAELMRDRTQFLHQKENELLTLIPESIQGKHKPLYWWLWRCLPVAACEAFADPALLLMPAETRLPDSSIWSHASITSALAGALAGYDLTVDEIEKNWPAGKALSHPYLAVFSFTPVQELIKASRKMRDFEAGSWILHYLSAKICWTLANQYGADTLLYPSLFQQPLIDHWLLQQYPEFSTWVQQPGDRQLLTAGFPNVIVIILPKDQVNAAMQTAKQVLFREWENLSNLVFKTLQNKRHWMPGLSQDSKSWQGWLKAQWQHYWCAVPIGKEGEALKNAKIPEAEKDEFESWLEAQNKAYNLRESNQLFQEPELQFLREAYQQRFEQQNRKFSVNVGSWWPSIFDQTRLTLASVKNARNWQIPTAFGPRSTLSGMGCVVHPQGENSKRDWVTEGETQNSWQKQAGLFDGREQLNATETVKRGLTLILPELLKLGEERKEEKIAAAYPDLTAGAAGCLKVNDSRHSQHFQQACQAILTRFPELKASLTELKGKWGIPWADQQPQKYHPRLLNSGWLMEDVEKEEIPEFRVQVNSVIEQYYPRNNPTSWYVLAAGDGDGMSNWLKGEKLLAYKDYIASSLSVKLPSFEKFLAFQKRMGTSTHNALSRALLDFSNQLLPYLTEQRYAGRLIYGGGDDVLAYTNLWEWNQWLWDVRQCFRGDRDPFQNLPNHQGAYFDQQGDYWHWNSERSPLPDGLQNRPLFTMGYRASISFGVVIANQAVPLAIALENLWEAEKAAKEHISNQAQKKDAVQVRVLYGNGNCLKATAKFDTFNTWQALLNLPFAVDSAIFEQAAYLWNQHPAPVKAAIAPWTKAFCDRRDQFQGQTEHQTLFQERLCNFLSELWETAEIDPKTAQFNAEKCYLQIQNWLKLAAFLLRNRQIDWE